MSTPQFPHAALLIDFDNVTMGIRSDLSKELKNLLSSDFIKGKVAVQRAYADWRRYPQYIVPLAESSVDLIFAPAYGSSKKNATDIRLAIDALELVFTRPEIGTFILLSGDSDFSSLVLKLKEYGKYVVGVGIRESASDLLVQNCDEYYSYSALTGLTRAGDETTTPAEDPWELVELAIKQMVENNDVMRSDRLKQVILEMDPNFDEKALGFQKFNRFMQEAASRGLVSLRKLENGQFEVGLPGVLSEVPPPEEELQQQGNGRRRSRRGRGRERERETWRDRERPAGEAVRADVVPPAEAAAVVEEEAEAVPAAAAPVEAKREPAAAERKAPAPEPAAREEAPAEREPEPRPRAPVAAAGKGEDPLRAAYGLLRRAVGDVAGRAGDVARDSDIKRRMLELQEGWDEAVLGFSKFSRFLRQAHDAEVINLRKLENGGYEASLASGGEPAPAATAPAVDGGKGRGRRDRGRSSRTAASPTTEEPAPVSVTEAGATQVTAPPAKTPAPQVAAEAAKPATPQARVAPPAPAPASPPPRPAQPAVPAAAAPAAPRTTPATPAGLGIGMRRGSRGRMPAAAPPPLLEGQTVARAAAPTTPAPVATAATLAPEPVAAQVQPAMPPATDGGRRSRRGGRPAREKAEPREQPAEPVKTEAVPVPAAEAEKPVAGGRGRGRGARKAASEPEVAVSAEPGVPDLKSLGLPTGRDAVLAYLRSYEGMGPKSVQSLVDAFGANGVFHALRDQPDRVTEVLGATRGERLLQSWHHDYQKRLRAQAKKQTSGHGARGRRGGRSGQRAARGS